MFCSLTACGEAQEGFSFRECRRVSAVVAYGLAGQGTRIGAIHHASCVNLRKYESIDEHEQLDRRRR